jgi:hypothetical protein
MPENRKKFITELERQTPIYKKVDVLVAGSGPGGLGATIAAARNGANTLLVERNPYLGGQATASLQVWFGGPTDLVAGIPKEVAQKLDKLGVSRYIERGRYPPAAKGAPPFTYHMSFDPETYKFVVSDMVEESGAKMLVDTWVVDTIVENKVVKGVIIENKSGRQAILSDVIIDATGDADVAARAGASYETLPKSGYLMPMVMLFRMGGLDYKRIAFYARQHPDDFPVFFDPVLGVPPGEFDGINSASIMGIMAGWRSLIKEGKEKGELPGNTMRGFTLVGVSPYTIKRGIGYIHAIQPLRYVPWNADDLNQAKLEGRKSVLKFVQWLKKVPGFESSFLIDIAPQMGIQDSRRIVGEYMLTRKDIREGRTFEDDITLVTLTWPDISVAEDSGWMLHPAEGTELSDSQDRSWRDTPWFQTVFGIPYRCLIPKGIDRLLVAGQTISMTYMAHEPGSCRNMTTMMTFGQAAGTAAAVSVKGGISPREIDISTLQKTLQKQGVILRKDEIDQSELGNLLNLSGIKLSK